MKAQHKEGLVIGLALVLMTLLLHFRNLVGGATFVARDHLTLVTPARNFLGTSLATGHLPQWWEGVAMGSAFAANPMHGVFYPLAWLSVVAPNSFGTDLIIIAHVFLLGLGTAFWARRLGAEQLGAILAGCIVMAAGYTSSMAVNGVPLLTMAWLPWIALSAHRLADSTDPRSRLRASLLLAALFAMALLSGDPAGVITAGLLAAAVMIASAKRKLMTLTCLAMASAGAILLAGIMVLPAFYLLDTSERVGGLSFTEASVWSMHPLRILEWFWPQALGNGAESHLNLATAFANSSVTEFFAPAWSTSVFIGLPVLALAYVSQKRALAIASLLFVLLALGSYTPLYAGFRSIFVPEQLIRYPERHLAGAVLLWSTLAGVGFSRLMRVPPSKKALTLWSFSAITMAFAAITARLLSDAMAEHILSSTLALGIDAVQSVREIVHGGLWAAGSIAGFVTALWLRHRGHSKRFTSAIAAAALLLPLVRESSHTRPVLNRDLVDARPALLSTLEPAQANQPTRLYRHVSVNPKVGQLPSTELFATQFHTAIPNTATSYGFAYVPGYDAALSNRLRRTWGHSTLHGSRLLQLYDIEYAYIPKEAAEAEGMIPVHSVITPNLVLARQEHRRPRAFVAEHWKHVTSDVQVLARLFDTEFALHSITLVGTAEQASTSPAPASLVPCKRSSRVPEEVTLECHSDNGGYAVLLDAWAQGWSATVDGNTAVIHRADALVRAVRINKGTHIVEFRYQTPGLYWGAIISLLAWALLLLGAYLSRRKQSV